MAQEALRGCGYRKVGGMYLCGDYFLNPCDRLPLEVGVCPVCGAGTRVTRTLTKIDAYELWGLHKIVDPYVSTTEPVPCPETTCFVCTPPVGVSFIMGIGSYFYTPQSFLKEAELVGVSKRIPHIPKELELGKTVVYLVHPKGICIDTPLGGSPEFKSAVICAFIPQRVDKLIWKSEAKPEETDKLIRRGITPVLIEDGDTDHL